MIALTASTALAVDALFGEPRRWHPLVGYGALVQRIERWLYPDASADAMRLRLRGIAAVILAVAPPVALCLLLIRYTSDFAVSSLLLQIAVLYFALGHRSLREHALAVYAALRAGDLPLARRRVGMIVSRDTADMNDRRIAGATVESVLENGADAVFGALFWYAVAGAPGALAYRLVNTLDAMWGYRTPRYRHYGWAAARLDDVLNWIPARLTALSYALTAGSLQALRCWQRQAPAWESPNAGPVMAAGAGALGLQLGGAAYYHGAWKQRPPLGAGRAPETADIPRSLSLLLRTLALWLATLWLIDLLAGNALA